MESFVLGMNEYFCNTEEKENKQALSIVYNSICIFIRIKRWYLSFTNFKGVTSQYEIHNSGTQVLPSN